MSREIKRNTKNLGTPKVLDFGRSRVTHYRFSECTLPLKSQLTGCCLMTEIMLLAVKVPVQQTEGNQAPPNGVPNS
jgi:hypothetical protein